MAIKIIVFTFSNQHLQTLIRHSIASESYQKLPPALNFHELSLQNWIQSPQHFVSTDPESVSVVHRNLSETAPVVNNTYYAPPTGRQSAQQHIAGSRSAYASSSSSTHSPHYSRNTSSRGRFITNTTPRFDYNLLVRILVGVWCVQLLVG